MKKLFVLLTIPALAFGLPTLALGASKKAAATPAAATPAPEEKAKPGDTHPFPYHGDISAVDAAAKTFTMKSKEGHERLFHVGDTAKITKDKAPAQFSAITVGAYAAGTCTKTGDSKYEVVGVKIEPKPAKKEKAAPAVGTPKPAN